ncbi:hypothetical protein [Gymnodinialimonas ulvae]|uniref:hypothetical protein n=1 Tax=Gymnodinialimonas ulvae TaxID=3126504 RepID=UPI0030B4D586
MTLEEFFRENARLYSVGDVAASARDVQIPLTARIGPSTFAAAAMDDVVAALSIYRANLQVESYVRTEIVEFHATDPVDGIAHAFVRYRNVNDAGAEIDSFDASFQCRARDDGGWIICSAESLPAGQYDRFLRGIPLA